MPTKKTTKKTARKKRGHRKADKPVVDKALKKNIAQAVERIPQMIMKEVGLQEFAPRSPHKIEQPRSPARPRRPVNKHALMWGGVIILSSVVFVMWLLNTRQALAALKEQPASQERQIFETARTDLRDIMRSLAAAEEDELGAAVDAATPSEVKATIKSALSSLFLATATTSIESTTTTPIASTTISR